MYDLSVEDDTEDYEKQIVSEDHQETDCNRALDRIQYVHESTTDIEKVSIDDQEPIDQDLAYQYPIRCHLHQL